MAETKDAKDAQTEVLHELIDLAAGRIARLTHGRADELHEALTPGFTDKPLTDAERAYRDELDARDKRTQARHAGASKTGAK